MQSISTVRDAAGSVTACNEAARTIALIPSYWNLPSGPINVTVTNQHFFELSELHRYIPEIDEQENPHVAGPCHFRKPALYISHPRLAFMGEDGKKIFRYEVLASVGLLLWNYMPRLQGIISARVEKVYGQAMPKCKVRHLFIHAFARRFFPEKAVPNDDYQKEDTIFSHADRICRRLSQKQSKQSASAA